MQGVPRLASAAMTFALMLTLTVAFLLTSGSRAGTVMPPSDVRQKPQTGLFTPQEQLWLAAHPVLRVGVDPFLQPLEFMDEGHYRGLTADYLAAIAATSGLRFDVVPLATEKQAAALSAHLVDLLPAVSRTFTPAPISDQLLIGTPYFVSGTIIVARGYGEIIFDPQKLNGKVVALKGGGMLEQILHQRYPAVKMLPFATAGEALAAVADGRAAAALGTDSVLLPLIYRYYRDQLHVAGTAAETPAIISIGVRRDLPQLAAIVEKSLAAMTARQTDTIMARWIDQSSYAAPSWAQILRHRTFEIVLIAITLIILMLALWHGWRARRAAEQSAQDKARFLAVMSHEIRTPMNAILASVELLARSRLTAPQRQLSDLAITASEALLELLDDVLDLSKLEARQSILAFEPTAIQPLAQGVVDMATLQARKKKLAIELQMDVPDGYALMIDATRIRQILINLLSNAVKFTERGTVTLDIQLETQAPTGAAMGDAAQSPLHADMSVAAMPSQGVLVLTVTDTGIGVPKDQQNDLFQPYVQAHRSHKRRFGGTGLGLTICRELCELMEGSVTFSSTAGIGTSVICRIPVELVPMPPGTQPAAPEPADGNSVPAIISALASASLPLQATSPAVSADEQAPGQVLVVEDHPANQLVLQQQLALLGYSCTMASDGRSALDLTSRHRFSLMLLDCQLPDMDGYGVAAAQRQREAGGDTHLPIIAISASVDQSHLDACLDSGMDGTLRKPLRLDALGALLEAWCGAPHPATTPTPTPSVTSESLLAESTLEDLTALQAALTLHDVEHALRITHRMRGAALVCGQPDMAGIVGGIEKILGSGGTVTETNDAISNLFAELKQMIAALADSQN